MTFKAKFAGRCPACRRAYPTGTPVTRLTHGWGHASCWTAATAGETKEIEAALKRPIDGEKIRRSLSYQALAAWRQARGLAAPQIPEGHITDRLPTKILIEALKEQIRAKPKA